MLQGRGRARRGATPGDRAWPDAIWGFGFLFSPALTIGGGTSEVQRNIIAERTLGLPHDPAGLSRGRSAAGRRPRQPTSGPASS